ncbi:MAG: SirB2 family protein [Motiliproteus sp.]|nr:SirB2 family protein [Motiliproteus sp.]MCW9052336.1 SirB2 family protein [Motiliproteus sp.]
MYLLIKHIHLIFITFSISLFITRAVWMLMQSDLHQLNWIRKLSQYIDTILLLSAIALTLIIKQYPFTHGWLTAKILALIAYIVLGTIALNRGKTQQGRNIALIGALTSLGYIIWVARSHYSWPWLI